MLSVFPSNSQFANQDGGASPLCLLYRLTLMQTQIMTFDENVYFSRSVPPPRDVENTRKKKNSFVPFSNTSAVRFFLLFGSCFRCFIELMKIQNNDIKNLSRVNYSEQAVGKKLATIQSALSGIEIKMMTQFCFDFIVRIRDLFREKRRSGRN
jgi:hypothetical protein